VILRADDLDSKIFTAKHCDALFEAILIDDEVDAHTELPDHITLDFNRDQLIDNFRLCRQLWKTGVDHAELVELSQIVAREGDLGPEDRLRYKYARAKFKHLRFAYALYGAGHRYPLLLNWMTTAMGHLQDAFKNGQPGPVARQAALSRIFLSRLPQHLLAREIDHLVPSSGIGFRTYVERQIMTLKSILAMDAVTGREFHETRKIISRQVSFYDTLRTIQPSDEAYLMSRSLSAINGLMGRMHDELIERKVAGTQDYHRERFALPEEIRDRLSALVARYLKSSSALSQS
jgi:hypothetical protein